MLRETLPLVSNMFDVIKLSTNPPAHNGLSAELHADTSNFCSALVCGSLRLNKQTTTCTRILLHAAIQQHPAVFISRLSNSLFKACHTRQLLAELETSRGWYHSLLEDLDQTANSCKMVASTNLHCIALMLFFLILPMRRHIERLN